MNETVSLNLIKWSLYVLTCLAASTLFIGPVPVSSPVFLLIGNGALLVIVVALVNIALRRRDSFSVALLTIAVSVLMVFISSFLPLSMRFAYMLNNVVATLFILIGCFMLLNNDNFEYKLAISGVMATKLVAVLLLMFCMPTQMHVRVAVSYYFPVYMMNLLNVATPLIAFYIVHKTLSAKAGDGQALCNPIIATPFVRMFDYKGRASRTEYWSFWAFVIGMALVLVILTFATRNSYSSSSQRLIWKLVIFLFVATILPRIALLVRRLHDIGKSGIKAFRLFIPIAGPIIILIYTLTPSKSDKLDNLEIGD